MSKYRYEPSNTAGNNKPLVSTNPESCQHLYERKPKEVKRCIQQAWKQENHEVANSRWLENIKTKVRIAAENGKGMCQVQLQGGSYRSWGGK